MFRFTICAFLAPALVAATSSPQRYPAPTTIALSVARQPPAPTKPPQVPNLELLRRDDVDNTCGFVSGNLQSSLTCSNTNDICATDTFRGVQGCCDPNGLSDCIIPTTCIPKTSMSATCTGDCLTNDYFLKCTESNSPSCYQWLYIWNADSTTMTQHACGPSSFQNTAYRFLSDATNIPDSSREVLISVVTVTADPSSTSTDGAAGGGGKDKPPIGAIVGGVVGGLCVLGGIVGIIVFILLKDRKKKKEMEARGEGGRTQMSTTSGGDGAGRRPHAASSTSRGANNMSGFQSPASEVTIAAADAEYGPHGYVGGGGVGPDGVYVGSDGNLKAWQGHHHSHGSSGHGYGYEYGNGNGHHGRGRSDGTIYSDNEDSNVRFAGAGERGFPLVAEVGGRQLYEAPS